MPVFVIFLTYALRDVHVYVVLWREQRGEVEKTYTDAKQDSNAEVLKVTSGADATRAAAVKASDAKYEKTVDELEKKTSTQEKVVASKELAEDAAVKALADATTIYDAAKIVADNGVSAATTAYTTAIEGAVEAQKTSKGAADDALASARKASKIQFDAGSKLCEASFQQAKDILDEDEKTVTSIDGLVANLNLCQAGKGDEASFLEQSEATCKQLREEVDRLTQGISEVSLRVIGACVVHFSKARGGYKGAFAADCNEFVETKRVQQGV